MTYEQLMNLYPGEWQTNPVDGSLKLRIDSIRLYCELDDDDNPCVSVQTIGFEGVNFNCDGKYNLPDVPEFIDRATNAIAASIVRGVVIDPKAIPFWLIANDRLLNAINAEINQLIITSRLYRCEQ